MENSKNNQVLISEKDKKGEILDNKWIVQVRKDIYRVINEKNGFDNFFTLEKSGLVPKDINDKETLSNFLAEERKQEKVKDYVINFNNLTKAERKRFSTDDIFKAMNGVNCYDFSKKGIHINCVSKLTLHSTDELLELLDIKKIDDKIIPSKYVEIFYYPFISDKYKIFCVSLVILVTQDGLEKLGWNLYNTYC